ncbi:MAG: ferrous iron transport protein A [Coriobacteriia bacterium]|nr:ferrous iron transport protein A [Coriobacteriia bacterium]
MTSRHHHGQSGAGGGRRAGFGRTIEDAHTLAALRPGARATIERIDCPQARAQALRLGMGEGATVSCITSIPAGPVVLRSGRQEVAVGRGLARRIRTGGEVA